MKLTTLKIEDDKDIVRLRLVGQLVAQTCGFDKFAETRIVTALLELGRNLVQHGGGGRMALSLDRVDGRLDLVAEAVDQGPGIAGLDALLDGSAVSRGPGLGLGLRGVRRIADRFEVDTGVEGSRIIAGFGTALTPDRQAERAREVGDRMASLRRADPGAMLAQQNRELLDALAERDMLMAEVHHRTKNNLALVTGLMRLSRTNSQSAETRAVLQDLELRVRAIATVHDQLQRSAASDTVALLPLLRDVAGQTRRAFSSMECAVAIEVDGESVEMRGSAATDLALAAGELMTNACKHAFTGRRHGRITETVSLDDEMLTLVVEDDGVGLAEGMERPERSESLGWRMIRTMTQKHEGFVRTSSNSGLRVELAFRRDRLAVAAG